VPHRNPQDIVLECLDQKILAMREAAEALSGTDRDELLRKALTMENAARIVGAWVSPPRFRKA
jgi:hypothetical protein